MPVKDTGATATDDEDVPVPVFSVSEGFILPIVLGTNAVLQVPLAYLMPQSPIRFVPLILQLSFMAVIVYRSSETARDHRYQTPVQNVLRAVLGSVLLGFAEVALVGAIWDRVRAMEDEHATMWVLVRLCGFAAVTLIQSVFTYGLCSISDYMFHRFIWHAHWAKEPLSWFMCALRRQYVQHYMAHHRHCHDHETVARMADLMPNTPTEEKKLAIEQSSSLGPDDMFPLWCSNHGLSVGVENDPERVPFWLKWVCRTHTALMYLMLPSGTVGLIQALNGSPFGWLRHSASSAMMLYITYHHDKFHCDAERREHWAQERYASPCSVVERIVCGIGRMFWLSNEMERVTEDHKKHHHCPEHREEHYGLLPYGFYFIYTMWQSW